MNVYLMKQGIERINKCLLSFTEKKFTSIEDLGKEIEIDVDTCWGLLMCGCFNIYDSEKERVIRANKLYLSKEDILFIDNYLNR